jgi:cyclopropane-fatty-acyl-phospholipid synthase
VISFRDGILITTLFHVRLLPVVHKFSYKLFYLKLNLNSVGEINKNYKWLKYNKKSLYSIFDKDYLSLYSGTILEKVDKLLLEHGFKNDFSRIELITHPRFLGYVFNPVSFFLCYSQNNIPNVMISEVHNTFGESHVYVCKSNEISDDKVVEFEACKTFHVSPFFDRAGEYKFRLENRKSNLNIYLDLFQNGKKVFESGIVSSFSELNNSNLLKSFLAYPFSILLTIPRITWQAAILKFRRKLKVFTRPIPANKMTFKAKPENLYEKFIISLFKNYLKKAHYGDLSLEYPNGLKDVFKAKEPGINAEIKVNNYDFFTKSVLHGDIGFGEAYVSKFWDTNNLVEVLRFFSRNLEKANDRKVLTSYLGRVKNAILHFKRHNSIKSSKSNISAHYDLSNELFSKFLDPKMQYSSALFRRNDESLETAQENKINQLIEILKLNSSHNVLEIGCGWGGLAIDLVKKVGCNYTGITLSKEQKDYFEEKVKKEGLESKIKIQLIDYRELTGSYDRIISVEMIEAVGHRYLNNFFQVCNRVLKKDGIFVMQAITIPEVRYRAYKLGCDWIQKYIFPGGHCPSLKSLLESSSASSFILERTDNIAESYANTLEQWRTRFNGKINELEKLGFDEYFVRTWNYYLAYCEAGFRERMVNVHQLVFSRQGNSSTLNEI